MNTKIKDILSLNRYFVTPFTPKNDVFACKGTQSCRRYQSLGPSNALFYTRKMTLPGTKLNVRFYTTRIVYFQQSKKILVDSKFVTKTTTILRFLYGHWLN